MRKIIIADRLALRDFYKSISNDGYDAMPEQPLDVAELVAAFLEDERSKYREKFSQPLQRGAAGDEATGKELGFGFVIEKNQYRVISVWSRLYSTDVK